MLDGDDSATRTYEVNGYTATMQEAQRKKNRKRLHHGPVKIEIAPAKIVILKEVSDDDDYSIANLVWDDLCLVLNKANQIMKTFLRQSVYYIQEFHPTLDTFRITNAPSSLCNHLDKSMTGGDEIFKKEQRTCSEDISEVNTAECDNASDDIDVDSDDNAADTLFLGDNGLADRMAREILQGTRMRSLSLLLLPITLLIPLNFCKDLKLLSLAHITVFVSFIIWSGARWMG